MLVYSFAVIRASTIPVSNFAQELNFNRNFLAATHRLRGAVDVQSITRTDAQSKAF